MKALATLILVAMASTGCVTKGADENAEKEPLPPPPPITWNMPLDQALTAAIDHGGETLDNVKKLLKKRNEYAKAAPFLARSIEDGMMKYEPHQLINATHLLMVTPAPLEVKMFRDLIQSPRPLANQLGWQLAAAKPSSGIRAAVEATLTRAITENEEEAMLIPQMANAIAANRLRSAYTWARQGLFKKGNEEFARAMIVLEPKQASDDFLPYLALAPAEELRQLTLSTVNLYTCLVILQHMKRTPADFGRLGFEHLFVYSVSRNMALAERAQAVLEGYVPQNAEGLAQLLARQPAWVQIAYLENARRRLNPALGLILTELKKVTAEEDVAREIEEIRL
jgi:hypothetical protein